MKTRFLLLFLSFFVICACSDSPEEKGTGYLTLNINQSSSQKSEVEIEDFILRISNGYVEVINNRINRLPAEIALPVGVYTVEAYSMDFSDPKFETPFYYGRTTVEIEDGETKEASLVCSQGNAGINVVWADDFPFLYKTFYALIETNEDYLHYASNETRTGYFLPGTVSIVIHADGFFINGGTITLAARDMVTATLSPKYERSPSGGFIIDISIDQTVNEREVTVIADPEHLFPNSEKHPYNIETAIKRQGENAVWITGYIVGANPSSGHVFYDSDNWQATNIVLADNISETDDLNVIFVQLPSGQHRDRLNLMEHPDNLHRKVIIRGNLTRYFQRSGLMNPTSSSIL